MTDGTDRTVLERRRRALARFAGSAYYRTVIGTEAATGEEGESQDDCDAACARILDDKAGLVRAPRAHRVQPARPRPFSRLVAGPDRAAAR